MNYKRFLGAASPALMLVIVVTLALTSGAWGQSKYKTLYKFKGGADGREPTTGLVFDAAGTLYGTTIGGGASDSQGTVFQLTPNGNGSWTESVIHAFTYAEGSAPQAGLILDAAGNLYGTTQVGGAHGNGTVFQLTPNGNGTWTESTLYAFCSLLNCSDGAAPYGSLIFDPAGNLYGTTYAGGVGKYGSGAGIVFQLAPNGRGSWTESVLHSFDEGDGNAPDAGLIFDAAGNLYGTTSDLRGNGYGMVFQLIPNGDGSWTESVLHSFDERDGNAPMAGLIFDAAGNLYGTTFKGGTHENGTVFSLSPNGDGSWAESVLHSFKQDGQDGLNPAAGLILGRAESLYGTTSGGGAYNCGTVFKMKPTVNGGWKETVLHSFRNTPGSHPRAGLIFDAAGNVYGETSGDGHKTFGSVFEITP